MLKFAFYIFLISTNNFIEEITTTDRRLVRTQMEDLSQESSEESIRNDLSDKFHLQIMPKKQSDSVITFRESEQEYSKIRDGNRKMTDNNTSAPNRRENFNTTSAFHGNKNLNRDSKNHDSSEDKFVNSLSDSEATGNVIHKNQNFEHNFHRIAFNQDNTSSNEEVSSNRKTFNSNKEKSQRVYYNSESNTEKTYQGVADFLMPNNDEKPLRRTTTEKSPNLNASSFNDTKQIHRKINRNSSDEKENEFSNQAHSNSVKSNEQNSRLNSFHQTIPKSSTEKTNSRQNSINQQANFSSINGSSTSKGRTKSEKGKKRRLCEQKYMEYMTRIFNDNDTVADGSDSDFDGRVLVEPGEYPHMTALGFTAPDQPIDYKCGGSLISENFVLTAAHCTNLTGQTPKKVRIGDLNLMVEERYLEPQIRNISRIFTHPEYRSHLYYNDIALLELEEPVEFTEFVRPIRLWIDMPLPANTTAHAMGYGATAFGKARTNRLTDMNLTIVPNDICNRAMPEMPESPLGIISSQICARDFLMNRDTCQGDSGGPLQLNLRGRRRRNRKHYHLIGITSYGLFCRSSYPSVYTRVSQFLDWIEQIVWLT